MPVPQQGTRIYFIDYTRAFIVTLVVVLHAAVAYLSFFPYKWVVVDGAGSPLCDYVVLLSEFFVMAVLFFIAGYLAPPSLAKHGPARFAQSRLYRLGIPFVFGLCVMCPVMTYVRNLAKGRDMAGYFSYWLLKYFHGKMYAGYLWFLSTLLIIMLLYCCACAAIPRLKASMQDQPNGGAARLLRPAGLLALGLCIGLSVFAINLLVPDAYWVRLGQKGIIVFQPTRLPVYIGFFLWGIWACRADWRFMKEPYSLSALVGWGAGAFICCAAYVGLLQAFHETMESSIALRLALGLLRAVGPLCITILLLGMFKQWCSAPARWKDCLAANAYGIYVAHIPIVVVLQYWLIPAALPAAAKFAVVAGLSLPLSFALSHFVIRRLPVIGRYF
ncbi:MAG: acyltransferase family protein [Deltaproteobacteria bacterium]|nr:acyltransferase family protein [Deltaproteobacteria bacterium]